MNYDTIEKQLIEHEGERLELYQCSAGKDTIGIGHNISDNGITKEMSRFIFQADLKECTDDLENRIFPGQFINFPEEIQMVLADMRFQFGHFRFRKFKKMITAFRRLDLPAAVKEMKDSVWYRKYPGRANDLIKIVEGFIK